eukprot:2903940-Rhodomonas_salina.2
MADWWGWQRVVTKGRLVEAALALGWEEWKRSELRALDTQDLLTASSLHQVPDSESFDGFLDLLEGDGDYNEEFLNIIRGEDSDVSNPRGDSD